ncbi:MAG: helix-turn-helix domain-containing protein [Rikenellaceae bacterium]
MFDAYIDRSGVLETKYRDAIRLDSYTFVICTSGESRVNVYTAEHTLTANSIITLLPNSYFRVIEQQPDTELYVVSFKQQALSSADIFATVIEYITHIIESPVVDFKSSTIEIICDYVKLLMRIKTHLSVSENSEFVSSLLKQFIIGIGVKYKMVEDKILRTDRSRALVMRLVRLIVNHYREERSASFYASKMHVSPQHLSSVVKQVTNRTVTDLIAMFVVIDAETKLVSSDLSIGEIAADLNFDDISTFGRYFKRYTKLSPRQYRQR